MIIPKNYIPDLAITNEELQLIINDIDIEKLEFYDEENFDIHEHSFKYKLFDFICKKIFNLTIDEYYESKIFKSFFNQNVYYKLEYGSKINS